jgi:hypothetical protein
MKVKGPQIGEDDAMANETKKILQWYEQYSHEQGSSFDAETPNFLIREKQINATKFIREFGRVIPEEYADFILKYGFGRITSNLDGERYAYHNSFMDLGDIAEILRKESSHWDIYPEFIADDEIPFFDRGDVSPLVFRKGEGSAVYSPVDDILYAADFTEFLRRLMDDCGFHVKLLRKLDFH